MRWLTFWHDYELETGRRRRPEIRPPWSRPISVRRSLPAVTRTSWNFSCSIRWAGAPPGPRRQPGIRPDTGGSRRVHRPRVQIRFRLGVTWWWDRAVLDDVRVSAENSAVSWNPTAIWTATARSDALDLGLLLHSSWATWAVPPCLRPGMGDLNRSGALDALDCRLLAARPGGVRRRRRCRAGVRILLPMILIRTRLRRRPSNSP